MDVFVRHLKKLKRPAVVRRAVARNERNGWMGIDEDASDPARLLDLPAPANHAGRWYRVTYVRFVDPENEKENS